MFNVFEFRERPLDCDLIEMLLFKAGRKSIRAWYKYVNIPRAGCCCCWGHVGLINHRVQGHHLNTSWARQDIESISEIRHESSCLDCTAQMIEPFLHCNNPEFKIEYWISSKRMEYFWMKLVKPSHHYPIARQVLSWDYWHGFDNYHHDIHDYHVMMS